MKQIRTNARESNEVTEREIEHRKLAREAACESIVLLKNDGTLPIAPCPVALYGAGAATTIKGGTGSGEVNERYSVTIEQGLKNAGFTVTTDAWLREYEVLLRKEKTKANKAIAKKMLSPNADMINMMANSFQYPSGRLIAKNDIEKSKCDTCIYVIARQAGECSDRSLERNDFNLTQTEIDNLKIAVSSYKKVIVVINVSAPMDIRSLEEINGINSVLFFCQQGMEGGNAFADIITGNVAPSGCLSSTWPIKYTDLPNAMEYSYLNGDTDNEEYKEGVYVGYRYFDSFNVKPRFEFGYGLSYTDFSIECKNIYLNDTEISVTVKVTNNGSKYSGKKIVQLYASAPSGKLLREYQSLAAFAKTDILSPGQSQDLRLKFNITNLAGYDEQRASFILEKGDYIIRLGESSVNTKDIAVISIDNEAVTEICENICKLERNLEEIAPLVKRTSEASGAVPRFTFNSSCIKTKNHNYKIPLPALCDKTKSVLEELSTDDMIKIVCATGMGNEDADFCVPGSAAYTTSHLVDKGVPNASLCDGPAGLRITRTSVRLKNGKIKPAEAMMEFMAYIPWIIRRNMIGNPKKGTPLYQYTSAFPVGTALAQTWNTELVEKIGKAIGKEMEEYGVTFLLAPGMNIHRNPLCGRNYEYYSEDPLLTGMMAAAITKGVQSFDGCYVTIKHFAANNQETNRNRSNSIMSERVLREIYLKGYRIAVENASEGVSGAKAVMTSYNKINGIYAPNSYDLCTKVLRCEWGFNGVVMTDWFSTGKGLAGNGLAIKAGNDLICPGGMYYRDALKKDIEAGIVSIDELKLSSARILEAAINGMTGKK